MLLTRRLPLGILARGWLVLPNKVVAICDHNGAPDFPFQVMTAPVSASATVLHAVNDFKGNLEPHLPQHLSFGKPPHQLPTTSFLQPLFSASADDNLHQSPLPYRHHVRPPYHLNLWPLPARTAATL
ncbi:uncharacterized protein EKO05_0011062 [Ascochyta rabiei]|uniref:uncharacterized protein n=1 Tax=Didymella rabiei TaxID=5454 RepID=UPI0021F9A969|nr:uncharacterized protein EKO05_0011062 [Ascochyta rabiei]UPX20845.1 hypothetical protein EKO05_0011062 [Ascochyta rabiei]